MHNPLELIAPYDECQFLNNLVPYQTCKGTDELLDLVREIQYSGNYYWQGIPFPNIGDITVGAGVTLNGTIQVPVGTYVTSVQYYCNASTEPRINISDKGSKASLFYGGYNRVSVFASNMQDSGINPFGQGFVTSPFIVTSPGNINWEIVNQSTETLIMQVLLCCAIPINNTSLNSKIVSKG